MNFTRYFFKDIRCEMINLSVAGARELSKGMRAELDQITLTGGRVCEMLHEGSLSMVDLADEKLLKKRLEQIEGIRAFQKKQICRFRETAYDMMMVKDSLEKRSNVMDKLEEPLKKHLKSEDFFDLKQKKTNELLKIYFKNSRNDVLRSVNPAGMNEKQLKELIKTQDKNDFSIVDMSALRLVARQMKYREIRIKAGRILNIRKRIQTMRSFVRNMDTTAGEGIRQVDNIVQVSNAAFELGKFGLKAGVVSASFVGKYTGAVYLAGMARQKSREQTELVKQKVEKAIKESKAYRAVDGKIEDLKAGADKVKASVGRKIEHNSGIQKYKQVQAEIRKKSKTVAQKDGVGFYGSIPVYSEYGDKYTLICNGCYDGDGHLFYHPVQTGRGFGEPDEGCADYSVTYECRGHYNRVCYGHKDIEIYLTVISMQEMFETGRLPDTDGKSYKAYVDAFEGWTEDNREWAALLAGSDWLELYGVLI